MTHTFVQKKPVVIDVVRRPSADAPSEETVRAFYRFRKYDRSPGSDKVAFLLQHQNPQKLIATLWRDEQLTEEEERTIAEAAFGWVDSQDIAKRERRW
jgi:hypothetical protein